MNRDIIEMRFYMLQIWLFFSRFPTCAAAFLVEERIGGIGSTALARLAGGGAGIILVGLGNFAVYAFAHEIKTFERMYHPLRILFADIEERVAGHQVDTPDIDTRSLDILVEHVDEIAGIETVVLTEVYIYAFHTFLGGAAVFLLLGAR